MEENKKRYYRDLFQMICSVLVGWYYLPPLLSRLEIIGPEKARI